MPASTRIVALLFLLCAGRAGAQEVAEEEATPESGDATEASADAMESAAEASEAPSRTAVCGRGIGAAAGGQRTGLRWDFVTSGAFSWSGSVDLGMWCERSIGGRSLRAYGAIDGVPTYLHLFNQVERRQPIWIQARAGVTLPIREVHGIGAHGVTNLATIGAGVHGRLQLPWGPDGAHHALDLRVDAFSGDVVGLQSSLLYDLQVRWW